MKKVVSVSIIAVLLIALGGVAFASGFDGPADIYSKLAGVSVEEAYQERGTDKTFGQLADEKGFLEEFVSANLESKKAILDERVKEGLITQEQADEILKAMEEGCTLEPGTNKWGQKYNLGFGRNGNMAGQGQGKGKGYGRGQGKGYGQGQGKGYGRGAGRGNGFCTTTTTTSEN